MKIAFRADASLRIGTGHVMRCLTLARALRSRGHECLFISRAHPGNLLAMIRAEGFAVYSLPSGSGADSDLAHSEWLGASQREDAQACCALLAPWCPDWLVVDHYALDHRWEVSVRPVGCSVLVIDDLADREHSCNLLIDQNLGRTHLDYKNLVPRDCVALIGPHYALLRPEFAELRPSSLSRRRSSSLKRVLIALGGIDLENHTGRILKALQYSSFKDELFFTVVLGATAPHIEIVHEIAKKCPWPVEILSGINDMAYHMTVADLAIGAGGATSWERCCLGLPTLLVVLAENQRLASKHLVESRAAMSIRAENDLCAQLDQALKMMSYPKTLMSYSRAASQITDGVGVMRLIDLMASVKLDS